jgi:hypothetical protein
MSLNSLDAAGATLFEPKFKRVVPLVTLCDESPFGSLARAELARSRPVEFEKVIGVGGFDEAVALVKPGVTAGFHSQIAPLEIIPGQSPWLCLFQDATCNAGSSSWRFLDICQTVRGEIAVDVEAFVFLRVDELAGASSAIDAAGKSGINVRIFVLSEKGRLLRTVDVLAEAAAYFAIAGWERFCSGNDLRVDRALLLPPGPAGIGYSLGVAHLGVDVAYHAPRLGGRVVRSCVAAWAANGPPAGGDAQPFPDDRSTAQQLLPRRGYRVLDSASDRSGAPGLQVGRESMHLLWTGIEDFHPPKTASEKEGMRRFLAAIKETDAFLKGVVLENARSFINRAAEQVAAERCGRIGPQLSLPDGPMGVFPGLRRILDRLRDRNSTLVSARSERADGTEDPAALCDEAQRRIDAVPSVPGAVLRILLIVIGLGWLLIAPQLWGGADPESPLTSWVAIGSVGLLLVVIAGVPLSYARAVGRAVRVLELVRQRVVHAHLAEVCRVLVDGLRLVGNRVVAAIDRYESAIDTLEATLREEGWEVVEAPPANRQPMFSDKAVGLFFAAFAESVKSAAHAGFLDRVERNPLSLDPEEWKTCVREAATEQVERLLTETPFDELVRYVDERSLSAARLVAGLVADARVPSLLSGSTNPQPPLLCWVPETWAGELKSSLNVERHGLPSRNLVAISVHPMASEG